MSLRLTASGWLLLGLAGALAVAGARLHYPELLVVAGALALTVAGATGWVVAGNGPVRARRRLHPERVQADAPAAASVVLANGGRRRRAPAVATDAIGIDGPAGDRGRGPRAATVPLPVPALRRGARATLRYELPPLPRGLYRVGPLRLTVTDPLGLARTTRLAGGSTALHVHPRVHALRVDRGRGDETHHSRHRGGGDLDRLTAYVAGDDVRHIHWPTSLRTGSPVVRLTTLDRAGDLVVVLDTDRSSYPDDAAFEEAVELAASLALGDPSPGIPVAFRVSNARAAWPVASRRNRRDLLDRLAEVRTTTAAAGGRGPDRRRRRPGSRSIVAVTGADTGGSSPAKRGGRRAPSPSGREDAGPAALARRFGEGENVTVLVVGESVRMESLPTARRTPTRVLAAPTAAELVRLWNTRKRP
jgi:uncharacterized protein (DUF58 family)